MPLSRNLFKDNPFKRMFQRLLSKCPFKVRLERSVSSALIKRILSKGAFKDAFERLVWSAVWYGHLSGALERGPWTRPLKGHLNDLAFKRAFESLLDPGPCPVMVMQDMLIRRTRAVPYLSQDRQRCWRSYKGQDGCHPVSEHIFWILLEINYYSVFS